MAEPPHDHSAHNKEVTQQSPQKNPGKEEAIAMLEKVIAEDPQNYEALIHLANNYFDTGQYVKAIDTYQKGLAIDNTSPDVWTDLAIMYRRTGQFQKAVDSFNKAISQKPDHRNSLMNKGFVLLTDLNDKEGAIKAWEETLKKYPMAAMPNGKLISEWVAELKADK